MTPKIIKVILVLLAIASFSRTAMGQQSSSNEQSKTPQQTSSNPSKAAESAKTSEPEYVDFTGFKGKIIELKHREPSDIISVISPLGSGFKGAKMVANRYTQPKSITIRDFPENIAVIEEAVKRLDVPLPPAPPLPKPEPTPARTPVSNIEVRLQVLLASSGELAKTDPVPVDTQKVIKELQSTLTYKNYSPIASIIHRGNIRNGGKVTGIAIAGSPLFERPVSLPYDFGFTDIQPEYKEDNLSRIYIRNLVFTIGGGNDIGLTGQATFMTSLSIRDEEQVVIGTSSLKDKGLILILSVKVIK